jgi:hypothetical protein
MIEAAFRQYSFVSTIDDDDEDNNISTTIRIHILLVAAARYISAHSPTMHTKRHN